MNTPINNVFLGGMDPLLQSTNIESQLEATRQLQERLQALQQLKQQQQVQNIQQQNKRLIWDEIDAEVVPLTIDQKNRLIQNEEYSINNEKIQQLVQVELLNLVKSKIESTPEGQELLKKQLQIVKKLKSLIIEESNREMELFRKFKEYTKQHPEVTYEEFIKKGLI